MMPGINAVDTLATSLLPQLCCQSFCDTIDTAYSGHNPDFITNANLSILAKISFKVSVFVFNIKFLVNRMIFVFECAR